MAAPRHFSNGSSKNPAFSIFMKQPCLPLNFLFLPFSGFCSLSFLQVYAWLQMLHQHLWFLRWKWHPSKGSGIHTLSAFQLPRFLESRQLLGIYENFIFSCWVFCIHYTIPFPFYWTERLPVIWGKNLRGNSVLLVSKKSLVWKTMFVI